MVTCGSDHQDANGARSDAGEGRPSGPEAMGFDRVSVGFDPVPEGDTVRPPTVVRQAVPSGRWSSRYRWAGAMAEAGVLARCRYGSR
jgi:hypothetical protein